eukprot:CAMPEP_0177672044 /NCGR_PEP_ID=MMETSP0447-20121125/25089_1 /TAXON_ID=0 /ORGANISM="Stygamoeba regulata, Strain BSH-02190019" /LENGTH=540 /DNA_ID=CAMNT_0019179601 /DNA_START=363 /DNA_END=1985 /DNA_ORIENTATION=+
MLHVCVGLAAVLAVLLPAAAGQAGTCQAWAGEPALCRPYLRWHADQRSPVPLVFVPGGGATQAGMAALVHTLLDPMLRAAPAPCRKAATQLVCLSVFPACADTAILPDAAADNTTTTALPRAVCRSVCESVNHHCGAVVDCDQAGGQPLYPPAATAHTTTANTTLLVPCYADASVPPRVPEPNCPTLFIYSQTYDTCMPSCPEAYITITDTELRVQRIVILAASCFVLLIFMVGIVPWIIAKEKHRFPHYGPALIYVSIIFINFAVLHTSSPDPHHFICENETDIRSRDYYPCRFQAIVFMAGILASAGWSMNLSLNIFMAVFLPEWRDHTALMVFEHAVVWPPILANLVVMEVLGKSGSMVPQMLFCLNGPERETLLPFLVILSTYYAVTIFLWVPSFVKIAHGKFVISAMNREDTGQTAQRLFLENKNLIAVIFIIMVAFGYALGVFWYSFALQDEWVADLEDRLLCYAAGNSHCHADVGVPYGVFLGYVLTSTVFMSPIVFMVFSGHAWVWDVWAGLLRGEVRTKVRTTTHARTSSG